MNVLDGKAVISQPAVLDADVAQTRDQARNFWRRCFWALFAISIVMLVATIAGPSGKPNLRTGIHVTACIYICCLAGYWIGLGCHAWRHAASLAGSFVTGLVFAWAATKGSENVMMFVLFTLLITSSIGCTVYLLRLFCGELTLAKQTNKTSDALQFGVRHILVWTTIVAVLVAIIKNWLPDLQGNIEGFGMVCTLALSYAAIAVLQIWTLLSNKLAANRLVILVVAFIAVSISISVAVPSRQIFWSAIAFTSQALVAAALFCIRKQGYRFVKLVSGDV